MTRHAAPDRAAPPVDLSLGTLDPSYVGATVTPDASYMPRDGLAALREVVAARHGVPTDWVGITSGASLALTALFASLSRAAPVLLPRPGFPAYRAVLSLMGRTHAEYDLNAGWDRRLEAMLAAGPVSALVLNSPGNPLGNVVADDVRARLCKAARQRDVAVILDETYAGLEFPGVASSGALRGAADGVARVGSLSKSEAAPGLRIGTLIAPPPWRAAAMEAHWTLAMTPGSSAQLTAAGLMLARLKRPCAAPGVVEGLVASSASARAALGRYGLRTRRPHGGPLLWIEVEDGVGLGADLARFCRERGLGVAAGEAFGHRGPPAIRANVAVPPQEVEPVFDRLGRAIRAWQSERMGPCRSAPVEDAQ